MCVVVLFTFKSSKDTLLCITNCCDFIFMLATPFRLANYKNGGELIDAYNLGGQAEVEKLIQEQFGVLMYADGKGQVINRAEYLRWKFRGQEQVLLLLSSSSSSFVC